MSYNAKIKNKVPHTNNLLQNDQILAAGLFLIFALLYALFRSLSLDDFDSVSFAFALDAFDLGLQQPQPPGFPVYIALGRMFAIFTGDPVLALTTLSAFSGALGVVVMFRLVKLLDPKHPGMSVSAAVLYGLLPVTWLTALKALSDVPGMTAILLAILLWLWAENAPKHKLTFRRCTAAFASGITLGLRPQNALPLVLLALGLLIRTLIKRAWHRSWIYSILAGIVGILLWLIPVSLSCGGLTAYIGYIQAHAAHVGRADSFFSLMQNGMSWTTAFSARLIALRDTLRLSLTGIDPYDTRTVIQNITLTILSLFGLVGLIFAPWKKRWLQAIVVWLAVILLQSFLTITLDRPRLLLPLMPPLCILVAAGWAHLSQSGHRLRLLAVLVAALIVVTLLLAGFPLAHQLATQAAPPVQALTYIEARWPSEQTLIVTAGSFRHAQYTLPDYPLAYLYQFDAEAVSQQLAEGNIRTIAILDRDQMPADIMTLLRQDETFVTLEDTLFKRERAVHTQHDQVRLQVLVRAEDIPLSALALPESHCIDIGGDLDGKYLGAGWYRTEAVSGTSARWAGDIVTSTLRFAMDTLPDGLTLTTRAMSYHSPQSVTVILNSETVGKIELSLDWTASTLAVPVDVLRTDRVNVLELVHSEINMPFALTNGSSADQRHLTAAWDSICLNTN